MKTTTACTLLLAMGLFVSCNVKDNKENNKVLDSQMAELKTETDKKNEIPVGGNLEQEPIVADSATKQSPPPTSPSTQVNTPAPNIDWDKKIIKTATVKYEVKNFDQFNKDVREKVKKFGGYIAQEDNYQYEDRKEMSLIVKVPVAQFEQVMNDMQNKEVKQIERSVKTEDVTGEVVDTKSRLEAKRQMRLKYLEFLKQSKNMEEVLKVQAEINDIQEEIESAEGRVQYLSNQAAYSTIHLNFFQPFDNYKTPADDNSFFTKTGQAFSRGAELIKGLILVIISIWPLILLVLGGWMLWRRKKILPITAKK